MTCPASRLCPGNRCVAVAGLLLALMILGEPMPVRAGPVGQPDEPASTSDPWVDRGLGWWSFRSLEPPEIPGVQGTLRRSLTPRNPIDAFQLAALGEHGIEPAPEADRLTLVRRATLDLTGLPPSPSEVDAFLADAAPDAYERLIDRLLASPRYGERWGRFWLDLARYADSGGFEHDTRRPNAWHYRDWVVEALNDDLPYDRFLSLQLAADELAADEPHHRAALGFLRSGPTVDNQMSDAIRMDELDDIVAATSSAFLGLTVACARCHDHKSDPIPTEDYYRLIAVFAPTEPADVSLASAEEQRRYQALQRTIDAEIETLRSRIRSIERAARERIEEAQIANLPAELAEALRTGRITQLSEAQRDELKRLTAIDDESIQRALSDAEREAVATAREAIQAAESRRPPPLPEAMGVVEPKNRRTPTHVLIRGRTDRPGPRVEAGPPRAIAGGMITFHDLPPAAPTTGRRAALADWIIGPGRSLAARVLVNRLWLGHFGRGLVETPSDFGAAGSPPVMPELLDWLAKTFIESGWSQKAIHRLIMTSATYRQSSRVRPEIRELDPENQLVARFGMRRLEAETLRDAILWCAGNLNPAMGGPGVFPPIDSAVIATGSAARWPTDAREGPDVWRRSLYLFQLRSVPFPLLALYDQPDNALPCPRRDRTTTPTQALTLWNSPFVVEQSRHFAVRVAREAGPDPIARLNLAHRYATGHPPEERTHAMLQGFLERQSAQHRTRNSGDPPDLAALADLCLVLLNSNAFLYLD